ncbi:MAG: hypothetical protein JO138_15650 [Acidobacteriaceae bacterium]|nr:hypothetical protein [Acidobacteriaceae bacterium]
MRLPFDHDNSDGSFSANIYLGQTYYAALVKPAFKPERLTAPPQQGGDIVLIAKVRGKAR